MMRAKDEGRIMIILAIRLRIQIIIQTRVIVNQKKERKNRRC